MQVLLNMNSGFAHHLVHACQQRENLAVDRLLSFGLAVHPQWFKSLGIDPVKHWCVVRPTLRGVHPKYAEVEVDIILGNTDPKDASPSLDLLVAVEAKSWKKEWRDIRSCAQHDHAKTNLWDQVKRNHECGFDRVAAVDIICTEPGHDYWEAIEASITLGGSEAQELRDIALKHQASTDAGYAIFAFGAVWWKDESKAGTIPMLLLRDAQPHKEPHSGVVEKAVHEILDSCPKGLALPYHFHCLEGSWAGTPCFPANILQKQV